VEVVYVAHQHVYRAESLRRVLGDSPIVTIGGVGLGTLWPTHTELKRKLARDFRQNPIIVLPSTLAFQKREEQDLLRDLFEGHGKVTVMARDAATHGVVKETFGGVEAVLVPDSAFLLPAQKRLRSPKSEIGWLARNDHEGTGYVPPTGVDTFDWAARSLFSVKDFPVAYARMRLSGLAGRWRNQRGIVPLESAANKILSKMYHAVSIAMLRRGNEDLDRAKVLVTDRFHAHILAILRGQPVVLLADAFGKNQSSYESWTHRFPTVRFARSSDAALAAARELVGNLP
jgi:pyruvyl transferase EpsO